MQEVEKLVISRIRMLLFAAFSFGLWQFSWVGKDAFEGSNTSLYQLFGWINVGGAVCWAITSYWFASFTKKVKKAKAGIIVNDELTKKNRSLAFAYGYFILFGLLWVLIPLTDLWQIDLKLVIRAIATTGIMVPMIIFSLFELRDAKGMDE